MTTPNETRRSVMRMAWASYRAEPSRPFADCLAGAWRFTKRMAEWAAQNVRKWKRAGRVQFGDLTQSPVKASLRGQLYAGRKAFGAAYVTALVGA
jgi:hypothetical protein